MTSGDCRVHREKSCVPRGLVATYRAYKSSDSAQLDKWSCETSNLTSCLDNRQGKQQLATAAQQQQQHQRQQQQNQRRQHPRVKKRRYGGFQVQRHRYFGNRDEKRRPQIVSSVKHLSNKLGELRSECKRLALVFKVASRHWIAMLIIRQESSEWRSYVTDSLGPWWYSQFEDATLAMTELLTYLPKMDSMVNVSVKQLFDGWNCGLYTLMNLRILIASLKKGVEPGFGILPPVANERSFFWEMCQHSAYEMKALL
uniref:Ubiquitin-like protease family profile domain-containing protein n=1 Tax=Trichogramma kaykai TaxID=54128 RepID=A0ABD2XI85_9HYME